MNVRLSSTYISPQDCDRLFSAARRNRPTLGPHPKCREEQKRRKRDEVPIRQGRHSSRNAYRSNGADNDRPRWCRELAWQRLRDDSLTRTANPCTCSVAVVVLARSK